MQKLMSNSVSTGGEMDNLLCRLDKLCCTFTQKVIALFMKRIIFILFAQTLSCGLFAQVANGLYEGLQKCTAQRKLQNGPVTITGTMRISFLSIMTAFFIQVPRSDNQKEKIYSASDGGFYYYYGKSDRTDSGTIIRFMRYNCDYAR